MFIKSEIDDKVPEEFKREIIGEWPMERFCTWDIGGRMNGKTQRLIRRAHEENLYIVARDVKHARRIFDQAESMGMPILFPLTIGELPMKMRGNPYCMTHPGVLVDNADEILEAIIGMPVIGATSYGAIYRHGDDDESV